MNLRPPIMQFESLNVFQAHTIIQMPPESSTAGKISDELISRIWNQVEHSIWRIACEQVSNDVEEEVHDRLELLFPSI